jgi:lambda repressor-like predicted transcriptional regulator
LDPAQFSRVHFNGLSLRQKQNIPVEKHETLTKVLKSVCKLIEEIIAVLGEYIRIINKPQFIVPENFTVFISSIAKATPNALPIINTFRS